MRDSRKGLILSVVLVLIAFFYFAPIMPSDLCPSIVGTCSSYGDRPMSLPNLIESWGSFLLP